MPTDNVNLSPLWSGQFLHEKKMNVMLWTKELVTFFSIFCKSSLLSFFFSCFPLPHGTARRLVRTFLCCVSMVEPSCWKVVLRKNANKEKKSATKTRVPKKEIVTRPKENDERI
eukprot:TRINITY_DN1183_c3_g1_i1.p2 TRINITY_DN1183_c3_g1~~TRINITY_DN1183_c3_g1_i1.p2  ORF type:complete len:114 (+),score=1.48 TRINITY_DN1183_c3_g1_i1:298-639(+)